MKSIFKFSSLSFLALAVLFALSSCGGDDEIIIDPGPGGIAVADGFYIAPTDADPTGADILVAEKVEDSGYDSQTRDGFIGNYIFIAGGSYNLVEIKDKEITSTWGGTAATQTDENSACDYNDYTLAILEADGAAIAVDAGLYKVTFDNTTKELVMYKIEKAGLIGSATPTGWGDDTLLEGTVNADGGSWSATDITMTEGEFKVRFNCRWVIDRRINPDDGFLFDNSYQMFTNFGGTLTQFETGGGNIPIDDTQIGIYTATINWTSADGFTLNLEKTGEVVSGDFKPEEHLWAILGESLNPNDDDMDGTPDGWQGDDSDLTYLGLTGNTYTWEMASIALVAGKFKFRQNDNWDDPNLGFNDFLEVTGDVTDLEADGSDFRLLADGTYKITMTTSNEGSDYSINFEKQ